MTLGDVILSDKERLEIREILIRMRRGEQGLYVRQIGPIVLAHTRNTLVLQQERLRARIKKKELRLVKKTGDIVILKEVPRERR